MGAECGTVAKARIARASGPASDTLSDSGRRRPRRHHPRRARGPRHACQAAGGVRSQAGLRARHAGRPPSRRDGRGSGAVDGPLRTYRCGGSRGFPRPASPAARSPHSRFTRRVESRGGHLQRRWYCIAAGAPSASNRPPTPRSDVMRPEGPVSRSPTAESALRRFPFPMPRHRATPLYSPAFTPHRAPRFLPAPAPSM